MEKKRCFDTLSPRISRVKRDINFVKRGKEKGLLKAYINFVFEWSKNSSYIFQSINDFQEVYFIFHYGCCVQTGFKVKETSKLGPRPEKPIEIYEFERYLILISYSSLWDLAKD